MKDCSRCKLEKELSEFYKNKAQKDGLENICKVCKKILYDQNKLNRSKYGKQRYLNNKEKIQEDRKQYYLENKDKIASNYKVYYKSKKNEILLKNREYYINNKSKIAIYKSKLMKEKRIIDKKVRLKGIMSRAINRYLREKKNYKSWTLYAGYTLEDLYRYLKIEDVKDNIFHIDHIIPLSYFNYERHTDFEFILAWRLENLQVLSKEENLKKGKRVDLDYQQELLKEITFYKSYPDMYRVYHSR